MSEWFETLPGLHDQVWQQLTQGAARRDIAARQPTLATISPDGWPEARTVVLRRAIADPAMLEVYTDTQSDKIASIAAHPRAALHFWEPALALQVRLQATVEVISGPTVADRWRELPTGALLSYGVTTPPGTTLPHALDYTKTPDQSCFCVLQLMLSHIDVVHLGTDHRRASFAATDGWTGKWVSP